MDRPIWNRKTMSVDDYQRALTRFLQVNLPPYLFSASLDLVHVLERLAEAEAVLRRCERKVVGNDLEGSIDNAVSVYLKYSQADAAGDAPR